MSLEMPLTTLEAMWVWTLNWGEVRDDLLIGSCPRRPSDIDRIRDGTGATALLSVQSDDCRAALGVDYSVLEEHASARALVLQNSPMRDFDSQDQRKRLPHAAATLGELLAEGHRTYVHCTAGINRAPLVVLAYLTFIEGMAVPEAMNLIRRGRPEAAPYLDSYHGCREDVLALNGARLAGDSLSESEILKEAVRAYGSRSG